MKAPGNPETGPDLLNTYDKLETTGPGQKPIERLTQINHGPTNKATFLQLGDTRTPITA